jgi:hypothetical protein
LAILVKHNITGEEFVMLGAGFGAYQSKKPSTMEGDLISEVEEGTMELLCVADVNGRIHWFDSIDLTVISVDGMDLHQVF